MHGAVLLTNGGHELLGGADGFSFSSYHNPGAHENEVSPDHILYPIP